MKLLACGFSIELERGRIVRKIPGFAEYIFEGWDTDNGVRIQRNVKSNVDRLADAKSTPEKVDQLTRSRGCERWTIVAAETALVVITGTGLSRLDDVVRVATGDGVTRVSTGVEMDEDVGKI